MTQTQTPDPLTRIEAKLDKLYDFIQVHAVEDARHFAVLDEVAAGAVRRIDAHKEDHREARKWWGALWIAVIVALIGLAATLIERMTQAGHH